MNRYLFIANTLIILFSCIFFIFLGKNIYKNHDTIEARRLILYGKSGSPSIILQGDDQNTLITLNDEEGNVRLQLQGGTFPSLMMKNSDQEVIGTFFPLAEGGSALALGNYAGEMATFIRGGNSPGMGLYSHSENPQIAMGVSSGIPHFLLFPIEGPEGMVIDGSGPTSVLFIDKEGKIPVSLSCNGLYQKERAEKKEEGAVEKKEKTLFSWQRDIKNIFPYRDYSR